MIPYANDGSSFLWNLLQIKGSVFPKALMFAGPGAAVSAVFVHFLHSSSHLDHFKNPDSVMSNSAIWGGFSSAVGFLVIFRTSQAYNRFWEGCTNMQKMGAEWYDACAALIAFTKYSDKPKHKVMKFNNMLIRLFSMLHAAACGEIEESGMGYDEKTEAKRIFDMELIDAVSFSDDCLLAVQNCDAKTEMIMQWIQQYIVENIPSGVLSIPPPILSRAFQEIATGMVHFNEAMKIANVPFPFPYAQSCDMLLMLHWFVVPFIISQWVQKPWWAAIFAFIMVFTLWTLNFIAIELENPFGCDANDIDGPRMQMDMNNHLRVLIREETLRTPTLKSESKTEEQEILEQQVLWRRAALVQCGKNDSFTQIWDTLHRAVGGSPQGESPNNLSSKPKPVRRFRATVAPSLVARMSVKQDDDSAGNEEPMGYCLSEKSFRGSFLDDNDDRYAASTVQFLQINKQADLDVQPLPFHHGNGLPDHVEYLQKEKKGPLPPHLTDLLKSEPANARRTSVDQTNALLARPYGNAAIASSALTAKSNREEPTEKRGNDHAMDAAQFRAGDADGDAAGWLVPAQQGYRQGSCDPQSFQLVRPKAATQRVVLPER